MGALSAFARLRAGLGARDSTRAAPFGIDRPRTFPLVWYYMLASVLVIAAALFVVIFVTSETERRSIVARLEHEADGEARLVAFDLVQRLSLEDTGGLSLYTGMIDDRDQAIRTVLNTVRGRPIVRVDIFDRKGALLFSTDRTAAPPEGGTRAAELTDSSDERPVSQYLEGESITLANGARQTFDVVQTMVPIFPETAQGDSVQPYAVIGVYHDMTESVNAATAGVRRIRLISVGATMAALFVVLLGVVIQGERAIRRSNKRLEEALDHERELRARLDEQNRQLTDANEAKIRFLSAVSHELKTPLTGVVAFTDILRLNREANLTPRQLEQLRIIERNSRRLDSLINDLLDLSRIGRGTFVLETSLWEISPLLGEVVEGMAASFAEKKQTVVRQLPPKGLWLNADRNRVAQVVTNLLSNGSKYSPAGSTITLACWHAGDRAYVSVRDEGIGISKADQARLFTEFFRIESEQTANVAGTGLGLAIVKSLVEQHGGQITVESAPGAGSTFTFWMQSAQPAMSG